MLRTLILGFVVGYFCRAEAAQAPQTINLVVGEGDDNPTKDAGPKGIELHKNVFRPLEHHPETVWTLSG